MTQRITRRRFVRAAAFGGAGLAAALAGHAQQPPAADPAAADYITPETQAAALAVAIGCSTAFLTPIAHPVNVLMMGPGGYTFKDFFKVGIGLVIVCFVALLIALPLFWKL